MDSHSKTRLVLALIVILGCLFALSHVKAVQPTSWPTSINDIDLEVSSTNFAVSWVQSDGVRFCGATQTPSIVEFSWTIPDKNKGEALTDYLDRIRPQLFTRELSASEQALCEVLYARNKVDWIVHQYRTYPTRPVYDITAVFPSVKKKIGVVAHSQPCGVKIASYSATITKYEWRKVTINNVTGVTVCRKK